MSDTDSKIEDGATAEVNTGQDPAAGVTVDLGNDVAWTLAGIVSAFVGEKLPDLILAPAGGEGPEAYITNLLGKYGEAFDALTAERDALKVAAAKAANAPKLKAAPSEKLRKVGPGTFEQGDPRALLELVRAADKVEILFGALGGKEVSGLPAMEVSGDAWQAGVTGLLLTAPLQVTGPLAIAGYGLFLDGKQVAWRQRGDVLQVAPHATASLAGDVVF